MSVCCRAMDLDLTSDVGKENAHEPCHLFDTDSNCVGLRARQAAGFLQALGIEFRIEPSLAEEPAPQNKETPERYAMRMARIKGEEVAARFPDAAVIAADTVVALGEVILGKPADQADALRMLQMLRGQTHQVVTGCCLFLPEAQRKALRPPPMSACAKPAMLSCWPMQPRANLWTRLEHTPFKASAPFS